MAVFWVVAPCILVVHGRLKVLAASTRKATMIKAANTSETSLNFHQSTRRNNPEHRHLYSSHREILISPK
jgi:hypothetical protein